MGNLLSCFKCGFNCNVNLNIDQEVRYVFCPGSDAERLGNEMKELRDVRVDVGRQVKEKVGDSLVEIKIEVRSWIGNVDELEVQVRDLEAAVASWSFCLRPLCCCCYCSNYKVGEGVKRKLERVSQLKTQHKDWGGNLVISVRPRPGKEALEREMKRLLDSRGDLDRRVKEKEMDTRMGRSNLVMTWINEVDLLDAEVKGFIGTPPTNDEEQTDQQSSTMAKLRGKVAEMLGQWEKLADEKAWVTRASLEPVEEIPGSSRQPPVGVEETVSKIMRHLEEADNVLVIGIYGMGGIGKTTLMREINRRLLARSGGPNFDLVIWAVASRNLDIVKIQEEVGVRLGYSRGAGDLAGPPLPANPMDRAKVLSKKLGERKFLLMLDDLWERLDLGMIGVPYGTSNGSKVVLTTRAEHVCIDMDCHRKLKVGFLPKDQSWLLFRNTIRRDDDDLLGTDDDVRALAEEIVDKCGGLPLALETVARAMATKTSLAEWRDARELLDDLPDKIRGMDDVLKLLKFSFDTLKSDEIRSCLLYCSLFPEDEEILIEQLVEYWIGAGLTDTVGHSIAIGRLRDRGRAIVGDLQAACLLEKGSDEEHVRMHDTVRDMAVWLGQGGGDHGYSFLSYAGKNLKELPPVSKTWGEAEMISVMENRIQELPTFNQKIPNTRTLLVNRNIFLDHLPTDLFDSAPLRLRVLDLSNTSVSSVPASLCSVSTLQYLNLSNTLVEALPVELGNLTNLKQLDLSDTIDLAHIPRQAISPLSVLQSLNLFASNCLHSAQNGNLRLEDLETSRGLSDVGLRVRDRSSSVEWLLRSTRVSKATRLLEAYGIHGLTAGHLSSIGLKLASLQIFEIHHCHQVEGEVVLTGGQFPSLTHWILYDLPLTNIVLAGGLRRLRRLEILGCHGLRHLAWLQQLPRLRRVHVHSCHGIVELLPQQAGNGSGGTGNRNLKHMDIRDLPSLVSISNEVVLLPSLEELWVYRCLGVKRLPIVPRPSSKARMVCKKEWWEGLEWGNGCSSSYFDPSFISPTWD